MFRRQPESLPVWTLAIGAAAGASAGAALALLRRARRARDAKRRPTSELERLEDAAVDLLRRDRQAGACAIDVAALAPGIIELTGVVPTAHVAQHAARLLHRMPGMRTVISRLEVGTVEERLASNRERRARGESGLRERRWYGVRVGTGPRRQSPTTEPDRPDDSLQRRTRELAVDPAETSEASAVRGPGEAEVDPTRL